MDARSVFSVAVDSRLSQQQEGGGRPNLTVKEVVRVDDMAQLCGVRSLNDDDGMKGGVLFCFIRYSAYR